MEHTYKLAFHNNWDVIFSPRFLSIKDTLASMKIVCFHFNYKLKIELSKCQEGHIPSHALQFPWFLKRIFLTQITEIKRSKKSNVRYMEKKQETFIKSRIRKIVQNPGNLKCSKRRKGQQGKKYKILKTERARSYNLGLKIQGCKYFVEQGRESG